MTTEKIDKFASVVQCPACGELVSVALVEEDFPLANLISNEERMGMKTECFVAEKVECKCGKRVAVTLTVSALG